MAPACRPSVPIVETRCPHPRVDFVVDYAALQGFAELHDDKRKVIEPLRHCLESIERDGLPCDPARGYSTLKDLLCSTEFVDRKNVATEETSKKEHGRFWTPEVLATLKSRQVKVLLLRLLASSDVRVCICLEDPAMMASSGRKARLLVYNVFLSPHSSDSAGGANRQYVPLPEHLERLGALADTLTATGTPLPRMLARTTVTGGRGSTTARRYRY